MYGFALCALPERFALRRFAVVHKIVYREIKGLIGMVKADLRTWLLENPKNNTFRRIFEMEERQRLPHQRQMLPRKCETVELCKTSLFFASRTLGTAIVGQADNATPDHLLPQAATPLQIHCYKRTTDLLCRRNGLLTLKSV